MTILDDVIVFGYISAKTIFKANNIIPQPLISWSLPIWSSTTCLISGYWYQWDVPYCGETRVQLKTYPPDRPPSSSSSPWMEPKFPRWIGLDVINLEWCYCSIRWVEETRHIQFGFFFLGLLLLLRKALPQEDVFWCQRLNFVPLVVVVAAGGRRRVSVPLGST